MIFDIVFGLLNLLLAAVLYVAAKRAIRNHDRKVRAEIALVLQFRSSFAPRKLKKEFRWLADMVVDPKKTSSTAREVANRYRRERELLERS